MHPITAPAALTATAMVLAFSIGLGSPSPRRGPGEGPDPVQRVSCPQPALSYARLELLFGAMQPGGQAGGRPVSEVDWLDFLEREITPRFPDGLTVLSGTGQWRNGRGEIIREPTRVLLVWYRPSARSDADISAIRDAYRLRFHQESVMRVDSVSCVTF